MSLHGDHDRGAAWRRRQRRLRMHWRHEQFTLQMLLATYEHHAAPRGQMTARRGGWERVELHGDDPDDPHSPGGSLPWTWMRCLPPGRGQRPVDQIVDTAPALPIPDVLVPLMGSLSFFDTLCPVAEQVIDVPKISLEDIPARRLCREPQLVEVPTVVSYSSLLQRTVEHHVDIPVSRGRGRLAGLQGSLPGQSSTAFVEQIVDIPGGGLQGLRPRQGSTASSSSSPAGSDDDADEPGLVGFRTFPR